MRNEAFSFSLFDAHVLKSLPELDLRYQWQNLTPPGELGSNGKGPRVDVPGVSWSEEQKCFSDHLSRNKLRYRPPQFCFSPCQQTWKKNTVEIHVVFPHNSTVFYKVVCLQNLRRFETSLHWALKQLTWMLLRVMHFHANIAFTFCWAFVSVPSGGMFGPVHKLCTLCATGKWNTRLCHLFVLLQTAARNLHITTS